MSNNKNLYDKDSIQSLSPLEFTRLRPGVYVGSTEYSTQLLVEIISNAVDEYKAGNGDKIIINGSYDVNIWYSYDNDTKTNVINETIKYNEFINVKTKLDVDFNDSEIIVRALKQPSCGNVQINGNTIDFDIEKELGIEVVGDTKVKIMVEDDEDKWEVFDDNVTDETLEEIDNEVNEDFLE